MKMFARALSLLLCFVFCIPGVLFALDLQTGSDYRARRVLLSQKLDGGVAVLFAATEADGPNAVYGFRQDNNFFYLTGWAEPGAAVVIAPAMEATGDAAARPYREILFLPAHNQTQEKWTGPKLGADDPKAAALTGFDRVATLDQMHDLLLEIVPQARVTIYSAIAEAPQTTPSTAPLEWLKRSNVFPVRVSYEGIDGRIAELRKHKDAGEIERIRHATEASMAGQRAAMKAMRPGLYEYQIAALMQYKHQDAGCEREAYAPIVGSGFYSTVLHYSEDSHQIHDGDVVVMDVAGEYGMYASDITRTPARNLQRGAGRAAGRGGSGGGGQEHADRARAGFALPGGVRLHQHPWQGPAWRAAGEILHPRTGAPGGPGSARRGHGPGGQRRRVHPGAGNLYSRRKHRGADRRYFAAG
jgi:Xaa-Pro aminopeptidase